MIGGMVGKKGEKLDISVDLIKGNKRVSCWEDGVNVEVEGEEFGCGRKKVKEGERIRMRMYDGGGYVGIIK